MHRQTALGRLVVAVGVGIAVVFAVVGCGGGNSGVVPPAGTVTVQGAFVGASVCQTCHSDVHTQWSSTKHAAAYTDLAAHGYGTNPKCLVCHTVGNTQPTGYVDEASTPHLSGVQCENCHGAGGNHVGDPSAHQMPLPSVDTCNGCHKGTRHGQGDEWKTSAHAAALTNVMKSSHVSVECLKCHSEEGYFNRDNGTVLPSSVTPKNGVTCIVCHDAHGGTGKVSQLRLDPVALCVSCHTNRSAPLGSTPRHGTIFLGKEGFDANGAQLLGPNSSHTTQVNDGCAGCHVYNIPNSAPSATNPIRHGHTFVAEVPEACASCHTSTPAANLVTATQAEITGKLNALAPYFTKGTAQYIDSTKLTGTKLKQAQIALYDYQLVVNDKSLGVHNAAYTRALLQVSQSLVAQLP